jgi:hypothetical protein
MAQRQQHEGVSVEQVDWGNDDNDDHFVQPATQNNINDNDSSDDEQQVFM